MRKLLYFLMIVIIALGAAPYFAGKYAKKNLGHIVARLNEKPQLTLTEDSYKKGWLHSTIQYTVQFNVPQQLNHGQTAASPNFTLAVEMNHGPVIIKPKLLFALAQATMKIRAPSELPITLPDSTLILNYDASSTYTLGTPDKTFLTFSDPTGSAQWEDMLLKINFSKHFNKVTANGNLGTINVKGPMGSIQINGGTVSSHSQIASPYDFYVGTSKLTINSIIAFGSKALDNLVIGSESQISDDGLLNTAVSVDLKDVTIQHQQYGPSQFSFKANHLEPKALDAILNLLYQASDDAYAKNQSANMNQYNKQLETLALELFSKNFNIMTQVDLTTPQGEFNLAFEFTLPAYDPKNVIMEVPSLLQNTSAKLVAKMPKTYVNGIASLYAMKKNKQAYSEMMRAGITQSHPQIEDQSKTGEQDPNSTAPAPSRPMLTPQTPEQIIQAFVNKGILVQNSESFTLSVIYDKGQYILNGKNMNLKMLNKMLDSVMSPHSP